MFKFLINRAVSSYYITVDYKAMSFSTVCNQLKYVVKMKKKEFLHDDRNIFSSIHTIEVILFTFEPILCDLC